MKKYLASLVVLGGLVLSCNPTSDDQLLIDEGDSTALFEDLDSLDMNEISLETYDLNMSIKVPVIETAGGIIIEPEVLHDDGDYLWFINIGEHFHIIIEDYAKEFNKVKNEKQLIKDQFDLFEFEFIIEESNILLYKRSLKGGNGGQTTYHCFGELDILGYNYIIRTDKEGTFKEVASDIINSIRSAQTTK